jgi:ABC-type Fe3+-hydroxamate transport system substrate-binding protein
MRRTLSIAVVAAVLLAGCTGLGGLTSSVSIAEQRCGDVLGAGGCAVTLHNTGDDAERVTVTVDALVGEEVVASGSKTVEVAGGGNESVIVGASAPGRSVTYEVTVEPAE